MALTPEQAEALEKHISGAGEELKHAKNAFLVSGRVQQLYASLSSLVDRQRRLRIAFDKVKQTMGVSRPSSLKPSN